MPLEPGSTAPAVDTTQTGQTAPVASVPNPAPASTPTPSGIDTSSTGAAPAQASLRDSLRQYGLDPSGFSDDQSAIAALASAYRQNSDLQRMAQYGQEYVRHADSFQAWMRERQEAQAKEQSKTQQWWKAPEYDPSWASKLTRDPNTGELRALPGADPSLVQKYLAWTEHQRGFLERFSQDPMKAIQPGIEQLIDQRAQQLIQQHLGGYREQTQAAQLIEQNSQWLHARDAQGQVVFNPQTGKPALSELGQYYAGQVQRAQQMGLQNSQAQHDYAIALTQNAYLTAQLKQQGQGQQAQTTGDAAKDRFLANSAQRAAQTGANGAVGSNGAPANPTPINGVRDLQNLMLQQMEAGGFRRGETVNLGR